MDLDPHSPGAISSYHLPTSFVRSAKFCEVLRGERERKRKKERWIQVSIITRYLSFERSFRSSYYLEVLRPRRKDL